MIPYNLLYIFVCKSITTVELTFQVLRKMEVGEMLRLLEGPEIDKVGQGEGWAWESLGNHGFLRWIFYA